jgi:hypothetical protein
MIDKWGWWWEKREESWRVTGRRSFVCVYTCCVIPSSSRIYKSMSMWGKERVSKEKATGGRGGELFHPCVSREAAMDACDNDFASKRGREAQVQQGFRSDDNGGGRRKRGTSRTTRDTKTHQQRCRKQHDDGVASSTTTRHPLTLIDTRTIFDARRLFDCTG